MHDADTLTMGEAAAEAGYARETFRKLWRLLCDPTAEAFIGFPPPFRCPPPGQRGTYFWRKSAVAEWKRHREQALGERFAQPPRRRVGHEGPPPGAVRFKQERATLARFINGRS